MSLKSEEIKDEIKDALKEATATNNNDEDIEEYYDEETATLRQATSVEQLESREATQEDAFYSTTKKSSKLTTEPTVIEIKCDVIEIKPISKTTTSQASPAKA